MTASPCIDILLATYNGAHYLPDMLQSLDGQVGADFRVLVRDDGSSDETPALLAAWAERRPDRVVILSTEAATGSAAGNFGRLMAASTADYVLFADQDDVWLPEKVAATVAALRVAEAETGGTDRPVMAFCDLALIDGDGAPLHPSFRAFQRLDVAAGVRFRRLLLGNVVTGCAMGVNGAALRLCGPLPDAVVMHDWWLALVCAAFGTVRIMPDRLILYRQHGGNVVGARRTSQWDALPAFRRLSGVIANVVGYRRWLDQLYRQACVFNDRYGDRLSPGHSQTLAAFLSLPHRGPLGRRWTALRHGFRLDSLSRTLGFLARL